MKSLVLLVFALSATVIAPAGTAVDELLAPAISGRRTVYFRVAFEKENGVDMREYAMPKDIIASLEKRGASVRPNRTPANVSYWIFFKNGDFATCDVVNEPEASTLPYAKLVPYFADAPHDGPKWSRSGETLVLGKRYYSVRVLPANDPVTGGRKGEVEIAFLDGGGSKLYYYFGTIVSP